jgi:hypothetical protein
MRTTLDIADDVLFAAKEVARREKKSLGQIISDLARRSFNQGALAQGSALPQHSASASLSASASASASERLGVYGIEPLPARGSIISNELIDRLQDAEGI